MTTTTTPRIIDVQVQPDWSSDDWSVHPIWADVDRPNVGGWLVRDERTARRLERALRAGVVYRDPQVHTDVNGQTYVHGTSLVLGRRINADLKRLGY